MQTIAGSAAACHVYIIGSSSPPLGWCSDIIVKTCHTRYGSSGWVIGPPHRPLTDNTQHTHGTHTHASSGIRTSNPNQRAAADRRLRRRDHWDRPLSHVPSFISFELFKTAVRPKIRSKLNSHKCGTDCKKMEATVYCRWSTFVIIETYS